VSERAGGAGRGRAGSHHQIMREGIFRILEGSSEEPDEGHGVGHCVGPGVGE